ncbi:CDP-glycerol glycerophosphotransferase family protein [Mycolicibacterium pulveris]|nr:CDP-glycerol glycerophosphotransferase family protein [Mycolicibacterium pulveris]
MVRAITARYPGQVYFLVADPEVARRVLRSANIEGERLNAIAHRSLTGLRAFVTAEVAMFTHGVYGCPRRVPRKTLVNLWHGDPLKAGVLTDSRGRPLVHSDFLIAGTKKIGLIMAERCRLPDDGLLVTGCPRIDQFGQGNRSQALPLGIDPSRPFVIWMPTFRRSVRLADSNGGYADMSAAIQDTNDLAQMTIAGLSRAGIQTVVKPHPSDADSHHIPGAITVTNDDLLSAGLLLYQLIGLSSGLLTDYSSVWIDYLSLDRPIAFIVPDEEAYSSNRGFDPPDAMSWLPGPRIRNARDVELYVSDVQSSGKLSQAKRLEVADHLGLAAADGAVAARIFEELCARGVVDRHSARNVSQP